MEQRRKTSLNTLGASLFTVMSDHEDSQRVVAAAHFHPPQISHKFLFWPPLTWNHIRNRNLGNVVPDLTKVAIEQSHGCSFYIIFIYDPFWVYFCLWSEVWISFYHFPKAIQFSPSTFIKSPSLSHCLEMLPLSCFLMYYIGSGLCTLFHCSFCLFRYQYHIVLSWRLLVCFHIW